MPYIGVLRRYELDKKLEKILDEELNNGELNYVISRIIKSRLEKVNVNYNICNEIMGVLECAKLEFYRKVVAGYEEVKIAENGKLY